jgi:uncharacterized protein
VQHHPAVPSKPVPQPSPETQLFWDGCAAGELRLQRCQQCAAFYFPPRPFCPTCLSSEVEWRKASGRGTLHTYLINHRPARGFEDEAPYALAVVQLEEGPRLMSNIVGVANTAENLVLDMDLQVTFESRGEVMLRVFEPAR